MLAELRKVEDAWEARVGLGDNKGVAAAKVVTATAKPEKQPLPGWGGGKELAGLMVHRATMDFDALPVYAGVGDFYASALNLTWAGATVFDAAATADYFGGDVTVAPLLSPPNFVFVENAYAILTAGAGVPGGSGLVGKVTFSYASPKKIQDDFVVWEGGPFTPAKVTAWTGPAGPEGDSEKLGEVDLDWYVSSGGGRGGCGAGEG